LQPLLLQEGATVGNAYYTLKERQQKEVDLFPLFFAFNKKQFAEGMAKFGFQPEETDKIYRLGDTGGYYRCTDGERLFEMFARHEKEMQEAIDGDPTGEGFILDMFAYELANHEYIVTGDEEDALNALGLTWEDIEKDKRLRHGFHLAEKRQTKQ
jgi:hypothetical protein